MTTSPFQVPLYPPARRTLGERLRGVARPDLARAELHRFLAGAPPGDITTERLAAIRRAFGLRPAELTRIGVEVWEHALESLILPDGIAESAWTYLDELQRVLGLAREDIEPVQFAATAPVFRAALSAAVLDRVLTTDERAALTRLATLLRLPEDAAQQAIARTSRRLLEQTWQTSIADGQLTAEEIQHIRAEETALGVELPEEHEKIVRFFEEEAARKQAIAARVVQEQEREREERPRLMHMRDALCRGEPLPSIAVAEPSLTADEMCHWAHDAVWAQVDATDVGIEQTRAHDRRVSGTLYVTDRRLLLIGRGDNATATYGDMRSARAYSRGLFLQCGVESDTWIFLPTEPALLVLVQLLGRLTNWRLFSSEAPPC